MLGIITYIVNKRCESASDDLFFSLRDRRYDIKHLVNFSLKINQSLSKNKADIFL